MASDHPIHADPLGAAAIAALEARYDKGMAEYGVPLSEAERAVTLGDVEEKLADGLMYVQHVRRELDDLGRRAEWALTSQVEVQTDVLERIARRLSRLLGEAQ